MAPSSIGCALIPTFVPSSTVCTELIPWDEVRRAVCALQPLEPDQLFGLHGNGVPRAFQTHGKKKKKKTSKQASKGGGGGGGGAGSTARRRLRKVGYMYKQGQRFRTWKRRCVVGMRHAVIGSVHLAFLLLAVLIASRCHVCTCMLLDVQVL